MRKGKISIGILIFFTACNMLQNILHAQVLTQNIRGTIFDKESKLPLPGASVILLESNPVLGTNSDENGDFKLINVNTGRVSLQISFIGYETVTLKNLILNSSKELMLTIEMEEKVTTTNEVTVIAKQEKDLINNKMASISARIFTIEETNKYAGSRGDPARMVMNYAGVSGANDQRNDIIIRGNSPSGILWRLDDVDVPNPNHFAAQGTTGGPISILNNNTLRNSDFMSGAFPAEYGNALSGAFDLKLRTGNNEKREYTVVTGINGLEIGAEGPFNKRKRSSYLANYRYSMFDLMEKLGLNMGTSGIPYFQDLTFKVNFPTRKGIISLFGIAGMSSISMLDSKLKDEDLYKTGGYDLYYGSDLLTGALSYTRYMNSNTYMKVILSGVYENGKIKVDTLDLNTNPHFYSKGNTKNYKSSVSVILNNKKSSKVTIRSGFTVDLLGFKFDNTIYDRNIGDQRIILDDTKVIGQGPILLRGFNEWQIKLNDNLSISPGADVVFFTLNNKYSIEPKIGMSWKIIDNQKLSFGYGMHSRLQHLNYYYNKTRLDENTYILTNKNLDFTRAHHLVLGWDWSINEQLRLKTEFYYQYLYNVPVETTPTSYSSLNNGAGFGDDIRDSLTNKGKGKNYGVEFTLEKFFGKGYYFLVTTSLFESKYKGSDNIERNTAFNGNYVLNGLFGKEIKWGENKVIIFDLKATYAGGKRYTPIDIEASRLAGSKFDTKYIENDAFTKQFPAYFKFDTKVGLRKNGKRISQEIQLSIENVTNNKNVAMQIYNKETNSIDNVYQLGLMPLVYYRLYF